MTEVDLLTPPDETAVANAIDAFAGAARMRYGDRLKGIYLFGSRARGDYQPFSDVDLALILSDRQPIAYEDTRILTHLAYDLLLETGAEIQPWPVPEAEWRHPARSDSADLLLAMQKDARPVWVAP